MTKPHRLPTKAKAGVEELVQYLEMMIDIAHTAQHTAHETNDTQTLFLLGQVLNQAYHALRLADALLAIPTAWTTYYHPNYKVYRPATKKHVPLIKQTRHALTVANNPGNQAHYTR